MRYLLLAAVLTISQIAAAEDAGFVPLFNGKDLTGWELRPDVREAEPDSWSVVDGVLTAKAGHGWLRSKEMYGDFVLKLDWRIPMNGNSGVFLRVPELKAGERPHIAGFEIQVLDDRGPVYEGKLKPYQFSGSIYGSVPATNSTFKGAGEWNSYEITCQGDHMKVVMNGQTVSEADLTKDPVLAARPRKGYIGLQNHASNVEYRNVQIKVLK